MIFAPLFCENLIVVNWQQAFNEMYQLKVGGNHEEEVGDGEVLEEGCGRPHLPWT